MFVVVLWNVFCSDQLLDVEVATKPPLDLFKSIFESNTDSESSYDDDDGGNDSASDSDTADVATRSKAKSNDQSASVRSAAAVAR